MRANYVIGAPPSPTKVSDETWSVPLCGEKARLAQASALVDDADVDRVSLHKWYLSTSGYAMSQSRRHRPPVLLHRLILEPAATEVVDHRNHNVLDNRRANLRVCTQRQNCGNQSGHRKKRAEMHSQFKGVYFQRRGIRHWYASIMRGGRSVYLGSFHTELEAANAYDDAAREAFGEFACLNFPRPGEISAARDPHFSLAEAIAPTP